VTAEVESSGGSFQAVPLGSVADERNRRGVDARNYVARKNAEHAVDFFFARVPTDDEHPPAGRSALRKRVVLANSIEDAPLDRARNDVDRNLDAAALPPTDPGRPHETL